MIEPFKVTGSLKMGDSNGSESPKMEDFKMSEPIEMRKSDLDLHENVFQEEFQALEPFDSEQLCGSEPLSRGDEEMFERLRMGDIARYTIQAYPYVSSLQDGMHIRPTFIVSVLCVI